MACKLVAKPPKRYFNKTDILDFYENINVKRNTLKITVVSEEMVIKLLKSLSVSKSTGGDNISAKFLKDSARDFSSPLAYLMNLSLETSSVPIDFKTARVVPLFKKGDRTFEGKHRPVSIFPDIRNPRKNCLQPII